MKNIYKIIFKDVDYDEYEGFVVIASTKKEAKELCGITKEKETHKSTYEENIEEIIKVGIASNKQKKGIVLNSFNAG